jgi:hypothetical protein
MTGFFRKLEERLFGDHDQGELRTAEERETSELGPVGEEESIVVAEEAMEQAIDADRPGAGDARRFGSKDPFD